MLPSLIAFTALIAGTIIFAPGINDATVDTIGFEATSDTTFHALLATLVTVLTTPLTTFLIPLNIPPIKNSGNLPPSALNHVVGFHHFFHLQDSDHQIY